ncbi:MAG: 4-hydroxy-2-oxoglutarate aldolase @ 2-dehydro-3-deoxyphosphogluconate aldolase, partial [uncultured Thermomicrobiales bacterium]
GGGRDDRARRCRRGGAVGRPLYRGGHRPGARRGRCPSRRVHLHQPPRGAGDHRREGRRWRRRVHRRRQRARRGDGQGRDPRRRGVRRYPDVQGVDRRALQPVWRADRVRCLHADRDPDRLGGRRDLHQGPPGEPRRPQVLQGRAWADAPGEADPVWRSHLRQRRGVHPLRGGRRRAGEQPGGREVRSRRRLRDAHRPGQHPPSDRLGGTRRSRAGEL